MRLRILLMVRWLRDYYPPWLPPVQAVETTDAIYLCENCLQVSQTDQWVQVPEDFRWGPNMMSPLGMWIVAGSVG